VTNREAVESLRTKTGGRALTTTIITDCATCKHYRKLLALQTEARENVSRSLKKCRDQNKSLKRKLDVLKEMKNDKTIEAEANE